MLKEKIQADLKAAMIKRDEGTVSILRMLVASILNKEIDKQYKLNVAAKGGKAELADEEVIDAVAAEIKKLRDSIALFEKGGRADLAKTANDEIAILSLYLGSQLSDDEVRKLVAEAVKKTGAASIKEMGKVMADLMPKVRGKAESGKVSQMVKEALGG
jgi:uncharacterized protein